MYSCVYEDEIPRGYDENEIFHEYRPAGWYVYSIGNRDNKSIKQWFSTNEMIYFKIWCRENLHCIWEVDHRYVYMNSIEDVTIFKLIWGV